MEINCSGHSFGGVVNIYLHFWLDHNWQGKGCVTFRNHKKYPKINIHYFQVGITKQKDTEWS